MKVQKWSASPYGILASKEQNMAISVASAGKEFDRRACLMNASGEVFAVNPGSCLIAA